MENLCKGCYDATVCNIRGLNSRFQETSPSSVSPTETLCDFIDFFLYESEDTAAKAPECQSINYPVTERAASLAFPVNNLIRS